MDENKKLTSIKILQRRKPIYHNVLSKLLFSKQFHTPAIEHTYIGNVIQYTTKIIYVSAVVTI